jgi:hypothetical protein
MAMIASNGPVDVGAEDDSAVRSVVLLPRRSPAERDELVVLWTWDAENNLRSVSFGREGDIWGNG